MFATLRNRNFSLLWFAGLISITGDWALFIGLPIYVYQLTQSTVATSTMFIAGIIPRLVLGSVAGVFVDRWDRKRTMVIANLLMGLGLLPLLLVNSIEMIWTVYLVQFFQAAVSQFFIPAEAALLPTLVDTEHLAAANALNSLNNNLARLIGPAIGGTAAASLGLAGVTLLDSISFWLAALLVMLIQLEPKSGVLQARDQLLPDSLLGVWREWVDGLQIIVGERQIRLVFLIATIPMIGEGIFSTLMVVFVTTSLGGSEVEFGYLMSAQAVGGLVGSLVIARIARGVKLHYLMGISAIIFGLLDLALFNYPAFIPGMLLGYVLIGLVGIPAVGYVTGLETILQTATPDQYRGRVWGVFGTIAALLRLGGTALAGQLGERLPVVTVLNVQGLGYVLAGILALVLLRQAYQPQPITQAAD